MSLVYTAVIQMADFHEECDKALIKLNEWLKENNHLGRKFEYLDGKTSAGTKYPECRVIWGGFNYLQVDDLVEFFKTLKLEDSLLTIKRPDGGKFEIVLSKDTEYL